MRAAALLALAFLPMIAEARLAAGNTRRLLAEGAVEPPDDVYARMQIAYPVCFLAMVAEGWLRAGPAGSALGAGVALFALAKALKYWAIATLGSRWTFRVLVPPRATSIIKGPYRLLRHPNYVGVAGEIAGLALMTGAWLTGPLALAGFGTLILLRIRVEERALGERSG
jgi:methyltransferase